MANEFTEQEGQPVQLTSEEELIVKEAIARRQNILNIDSAKELSGFKQMLSWRRRRTRILWSAAASLIFIIGIGAGLLLSDYNPFRVDDIVVYEADDSIDGVMLYVNGKGIDLQNDSASTAVNRTGATLAKDELTYNQDSEVQSNTLSVPNGKTYCVTLSDGTTVWMNSHSTLTYPSAFTGDERRVILKGEAYFKVTKDKTHPFVVEANGVETKVLGTEFNVRQYETEPSNITLVEGSVLVKMQKHGPVRLQPGQNIRIQDNGQVEVENVDIREYTEWKSGFFYFDNRTLNEVFRIIGRYYNVSVMCSSQKMMNTHFNLWIDMNRPLKDNLELINEVGGLHAYLNGEKVIIK